MQGVGDDHPHIAVNAAGENVFAGAGREVGPPLVVYPDGDHVVTGIQIRREVDGESGVAAIVAAGLAAVHKHLALLEGGFEIEPQPAVLRQHGQGELLAVPALADEEVRRAEVGDGKRVGQPDAVPLRVVELRRGGQGGGFFAERETEVAVKQFLGAVRQQGRKRE